MARICEVCGAQTLSGSNRMHKRGSSGAGGVWAHKAPRTLHKWKPNLRKVKVLIDTTPASIKVCMKCYKKIRQQSELATA